jgi:PadR family transcriptional regulator PadR
VAGRALVHRRVLIRPCLLLVLAEAPGHGYDLVDRLRPLGFDWQGPGPIYQHLRNLERAGLLRSAVTARNGPARRIYEITAEGLVALDSSAAGVARLIDLADDFIRRYAMVTAPDANL